MRLIVNIYTFQFQSNSTISSDKNISILYFDELMNHNQQSRKYASSSNNSFFNQRIIKVNFDTNDNTHTNILDKNKPSLK